MVFSELPVGAEFFFGTYSVNRYNYTLRKTEEKSVDIKWRKTNDNQLSICLSDCVSCCFDYPHNVTGTNRYMRDHGHRLFTESILAKFLNCTDRSWTETGDDASVYGNDTPGFLSMFSDEDKKLIVPHTVEVTCPTGYTKKYGTSVKKQYLVSIPSLEQLGVGGMLGTFGINISGISTWTTSADTLNKFYRRGYISRMGCDRYSSVKPVIRIKDDAPVDLGYDGMFYIRIPEPEFDGNLDALLGWETESAA